MENFYNIERKELYRDDYFFIMKDCYPVSPGHLLIISNQIRRDYFDLTKKEKESLVKVIDVAKKIIENEYQPDGYNIGMNCGVCGGQTVFHFHCHVIPRYAGDMENPKGGVRHCVKDKGYY